MFRCDTCHTEYGGIRGVPAGTCPRCREQRADLSRPVAASASLASASSLAAASAYPALASGRGAREPLTGEIARLDRLVRF